MTPPQISPQNPSPNLSQNHEPAPFNPQLFQISYASPLGEITLVAHDAALAGLWFEGQKHFARVGNQVQNQSPILRENQILVQTKCWLDAYFRGEIPNPREIPLDPRGTDFQRRVWQILVEIPHGATLTYGEIAQKIVAQSPNARNTLAQNPPTCATKFSARAVGGAVGRNPISIIIPCHRVVGANGKLTGYAGGLDKKRALLKLENIDLAQFR